jgi:spermidine synthase
MLVVGLGGGTIPGVLHKHYPEATIDVVDIDPDVVRVAKEFFGFREDARMHAYVDDGRRFIENCGEPYDLIFLDAYSAEEIPYHLATQQFLAHVRRALSPKGVAVANVWSSDSNPLYDSMVRTYQAAFNELYILDVQGGGNKILLALPRRQWVQRDDLAKRGRAVSKERRFRYDLGHLVTYGFRPAGKPDGRASVLMDKQPTTTTSTQPAQTRP